MLFNDKYEMCQLHEKLFTEHSYSKYLTAKKPHIFELCDQGVYIDFAENSKKIHKGCKKESSKE